MKVKSLKFESFSYCFSNFVFGIVLLQDTDGQRMNGAIPPLPQYAFMAWCLVKAQDTVHAKISTYHCACTASVAKRVGCCNFLFGDDVHKERVSLLREYDTTGWV